MLEIDIPGRGAFEIHHVVCDYNGTIAADGRLEEGVASRIQEIAEYVQVSVLTADAFGTVRAECTDLPVDVRVFDRDDASACKAAIVRKLGPQGCVCIGNGFNDIAMFGEAALSFGIVGKEGACGRLLACSDVVATNPIDAFDLLIHVDRLRATLRG
ncbi:HAD family hydrolase [uncultured Slackia sp.]|uniref:HAD family hydrolase n=1 Tax=uncultured Slackia sp. TaxID=665903 RepID=UPI0026762B2B|nr:ATPase P [uncultured Slackia sp.]